MNDAATALAHLRSTCRTMILATTGPDGAPDASYTPFIDDDGAFLILVSALARHTGNLIRSGRASVMLIEDEAAMIQPFARRRVTYACHVEDVPRNTAAWDAGLAKLDQRHGAVVMTLRELPDFQLLRLIPEHGSLVLGFGQAWRLVGPGCATLEPIGPR